MNKCKKKIIVIGLKGLPAFGGAAAVGENILLKLKNDYEFVVLSISTHTNKNSGPYKGFEQIVFRSIFGRGGVNTITYYLLSLFYVLFHKCDLVHLHHAASGFIIPIINLKCNTILTVHGYSEEYDSKFNRFLNFFANISQKIALKNATEVVSVSNADKRLLEIKCHRPIYYIPNGVNPVSIKANNTHTPYILFSAGRIYELKGLHLLISAANYLNLKEQIKIVGDIDRVPKYRDKILEDCKYLKVDILGLIKEKEKLMNIVANSELFIFPSLFEGMSMMLLEVASLKVPIIASDIEANKAVFSSDEVLFFKSGDYLDLAEKIEYALDHRNEMISMSERAQKKLLANYNWTIISKRYSDIYNRLLGE